jgi:hypothetical protein
MNGHRVLVPEPRPTSDVAYHHDRAPGQKYLILDDGVVPGSPVYVALRRINVVPPDQPRWLDPHEHHCNSFYVFLGDGPSLSGLQAMATIGDLTIPINSPSAVLVPPWIAHHYWYTFGSGWYFQITLSPDYSSSLVPPGEMGRGTGTAPHVDDVYQVASADGSRQVLISPELFESPGLAVTVGDPSSLNAHSESFVANGVCLDVVLGHASEPATIELNCHGDATQLTSPCAVLHVGDVPRFTKPQGNLLLVRIQPDAPLRSPSPADARFRSGRGG